MSEKFKKINESIGNRLRVCRSLRGHSEEHVSKLLGISLKEYRNIERGKANIPVSLVVIFCEQLDVPVESALIEFEHCFYSPFQHSIPPKQRLCSD